MTSNNNKQQMKSSGDFISMKDMFYLCLSKWKWFVVSLILTLSLSWLYVYTTEPEYVRNISFLLKNTPNEQTKIDNDYGLSALHVNTTRNDELMALRSPLIIEKVVKELNLENEYTEESNLRSRILYGRELPLNVLFLDSIQVDNVSMVIRLREDGKVEISDIYGNGIDYSTEEPIVNSTGVPVKTPIGNIEIVLNAEYHGVPDNHKIKVSGKSTADAVNDILRHLSVKVNDDKSGLINLSLSDTSPQRAEDVLNTLISVYDENWQKENSARAIKVSEFINDRIGVIESNLEGLEDSIASYKSRNLISDVSAESGMYMQQLQDASNNLQALKTQQSIVQYVRYCLTDNMDKYQMLTATGLGNTTIENQIAAYNTLLSQRNKLTANGEQHPQAVETEQNLKVLRTSILLSIDNIDASINLQINDLQKNADRITKHLELSPKHNKQLMTIERQQKVKESIYLYLLQRLEENELNKTDILSNIKIISPVSGSGKPVAPLKDKCLLLAIVLGLFIPIVIIFIVEVSDTMIHNRKDLESLSLPIAGEIPMVNKEKSIFRKKTNDSISPVMVLENSHDIINEAFRIMRTNLTFIGGKENKSKLMMVTSFQSNSGKTFITINLAMSLAIQKKKVLVIDLDMRKATASKYADSPHNGISRFLNGTINGYEDIIIHGKIHPNMDMIPVGIIPPNPAELLSEDRLTQLLNDVKNRYDYVLIDCPPLNIVADSHIINKLVDMTLFVIRAGIFDKSMLPNLEQLYEEHNRKGYCVLLNGIELNNRYGYNRYGDDYNSYGGGITGSSATAIKH